MQMILRRAELCTARFEDKSMPVAPNLLKRLREGDPDVEWDDFEAFDPEHESIEEKRFKD